MYNIHVHGVIVSTPNKDRTLFPGCGAVPRWRPAGARRSPWLVRLKHCSARWRLRTHSSCLWKLPRRAGRVLGFLGLKMEYPPKKLMDLMVWSSSSLLKMAFWLGLWAFFCLPERRSPVKLAIWWYNLCCFPQFSSSFPVFPPFYPCFPPVSPHFPWHFPWWFPCASPSEDLRLAEASLEELLRHRRHTAFYKAGAELPKPH